MEAKLLPDKARVKRIEEKLKKHPELEEKIMNRIRDKARINKQVIEQMYQRINYYNN